jgi:hypothetical protein
MSLNTDHSLRVASDAAYSHASMSGAASYADGAPVHPAGITSANVAWDAPVLPSRNMARTARSVATPPAYDPNAAYQRGDSVSINGNVYTLMAAPGTRDVKGVAPEGPGVQRGPTNPWWFAGKVANQPGHSATPLTFKGTDGEVSQCGPEDACWTLAPCGIAVPSEQVDSWLRKIDAVPVKSDPRFADVMDALDHAITHTAAALKALDHPADMPLKPATAQQLQAIFGKDILQPAHLAELKSHVAQTLDTLRQLKRHDGADMYFGRIGEVTPPGAEAVVVQTDCTPSAGRIVLGNERYPDYEQELDGTLIHEATHLGMFTNDHWYGTFMPEGASTSQALSNAESLRWGISALAAVTG